MKSSIFISIFVILLTCKISNSQVTFSDVAVSLGVNDAGAAQGCIFLDVNNDGYLDIFLANNNTPSKLWINNNGTSFTDGTVSWAIAINSPTRGCSAADYDNDGKVDIMIGNWQAPIMFFKNYGANFGNIASYVGLDVTSYGGSLNWLDYNNDGAVDVYFGNDGMPPKYDFMFKNNLTGFTNLALSIGLNDSASTLAVASGDYDNDGDIDIFLGTQSHPGFSYTSILYRNNGNGTFTNVTEASGIMTTFYTWGAEWGDYNNDGYLDLALANTTGLLQIYKNNGDGTFTDVATSIGINEIGQAYSVGWADYDNHGDLDLYFARGQTYADKLYRNDGATFTDVSTAVGMGDLRHSSCISWGDYNNDGFLDLYLNNNGTENRLYKNNAESTNKWIILKLVGVNSNKSAIGARVRIKTGTKTQIREVEGGSGGKGQNSLPVEFGIGTSTIIDSLIIRWPNGLEQGFANVNPNQIITVTEGQPIGITNISSNLPVKFQLEQNYPNPFNPTTKIRFDIPVGQRTTNNVQLIIYDILGREAATLINEQLAPGTYAVDWNAESFNSGTYFYKLSSEDPGGSGQVFTETKKMILVK
jgi:hypothetical protein